ncbi:MAG TPA: sigma-70 family RNA polymerase sigma factor [Candidatus Acidoferrum sp.]|nr:sigma-70 family RNA polymerase sigma factor [Candidatus Acidoferrum sp.]
MADFDLIRCMADQRSNFAAAREAWEQFYLRHHRVLMYICMSDHGYLLGQDDVNDVVQDTFLKAFNRAESFDYQESCPADIQERKCRAWLAAIAENIVRDRFRGQIEISVVDEMEVERTESPGQEVTDETEIPEPERLRLLKSAFASLSETEQTVLRATMSWWQPDHQHQRMPHAAMQELCRQIGKSPDNIRQIRSRAMDKLEKYVNENVQNEE